MAGTPNLLRQPVWAACHSLVARLLLHLSALSLSSSLALLLSGPLGSLRFSQLQAFASLGRRLLPAPCLPFAPHTPPTLPRFLCSSASSLRSPLTQHPCARACRKPSTRPPAVHRQSVSGAAAVATRARFPSVLSRSLPSDPTESPATSKPLCFSASFASAVAAPPLAWLVTGRSEIHHPTTHPRREPQPLNFGRNALRDILSPPPPSSSTTSTSLFSSNDFSRLSTPPPPSHLFRQRARPAARVN